LPVSFTAHCPGHVVDTTICWINRWMLLTWNWEQLRLKLKYSSGSKKGTKIEEKYFFRSVQLLWTEHLEW
jgi:hypothetical protein